MRRKPAKPIREPAPPVTEPEIRAYVEFLGRELEELENVANAALGGENPQAGGAVAARRQMADLRKQIARYRTWLAKRPAPAKRNASDTKREIALRLIASGKTTTETAAELGVNRRTVNLWRTPEFEEELRELQAAETDAVHALFVARQVEMMNALIDVATAPDTVDMARVNAIRTFFELGGKHKNAPVSQAERLGEIESEDDVQEALAEIPVAVLQRSIDTRNRVDATTPKRPGRSKAREL